MMGPTQIKRALRCAAGEERGEKNCLRCPYRGKSSCISTAVKDALEYIDALEQAAKDRINSRGGRIRTVYLYTITDEAGKTLCTDATAAEAAAAIGYETRNGLTYAWSRQQRGNALPIRIERRKGMIGDPKQTYRAPLWIYTARRKGQAPLQGLSIRELAGLFGMKPSGLRSALTQLGIDSRPKVVYRGYEITRTNTKE